jgi:hypothetical protein
VGNHVCQRNRGEAPISTRDKIQIAVAVILILLAIIISNVHGQNIVIPSQTLKQPANDEFEAGDRILLLKGKAFNGSMKSWLVLESQNGLDWKHDGYDVSRTRIFSDYMPVCRRLRSGQWEVAFVNRTTPLPKPTPCP